MSIYLVRHGRDDEDYRGGWSQRGLNAEGYRQSERLGNYFAGGESPNEFFTRIKDVFEKLCREQEEQLHSENVLVVTHGGVINLIYHLVRGLEWTNLSKAFPSSYTSVYKIEHSSSKWGIQLAYQESNT
ncbi:histidine phosphatase family protein [Paenibacillus ihuae]|uniref:histidine phosphatase family protein n=1 Tax=Paenibacillus ihuae TaxID=1232431 RepID=UPI0006D57819|nr:histidine phosphatase family protein [Paenibacillus ihuae]